MSLRSLKTKMDQAMVDVVARLDRLYQEKFFKAQDWPVLAGQYIVGRKDSSVAVCTLGSMKLMRQIGRRDEIAIVGKTFTENLGIEKVIRNIVTNPSIRFLLLCGKESPHRVGQSLIVLKTNGVDAEGRIIESQGKVPVLKNVAREEIDRFRQQIEIIDLIGEREVEPVMARVRQAAGEQRGMFEGAPVAVASSSAVEQVSCWHRESLDYEADPAGFFVIQVDRISSEILVEHYSTAHELIRVLHGKTALVIYCTMIRDDWVTNRGHAAYLGRELCKAELALQRGWLYEQNKELMES